MNFESSRLRTFQNWPENAPIDGPQIARAGFYYMGQNLEVQCFSCGGRISEWHPGDKVMARHRLLDPRCPFILNPADSRNVPIISDEGSQGTSATEENDSHFSPTTENIFKTEDARIASFIGRSNISLHDICKLAKAGLYWHSEMAKILCAYCGKDVFSLDADDLMMEHRRKSPACPFLNSLSVSRSSQNPNDVIVIRDNYLSVDDHGGLDMNQMKDFGITNHRIPKHHRYLTEESRLNSFESWPMSHIKTPLELAKAGFYYTGVEDKVRCYHCGGGLQKWKISDDPWIEHAKWFSQCDFVRLVKGQEFTEQIKEMLESKKITKEDLNGDEPTTSTQNERNFSSSNVDDNLIQSLMTTSTVLTVLELGLDVSRIKQVLRDRLERHQTPFKSVDELLSAVLDAQFNEPVADLTEESWINDSLVGVSDSNRLSLFENNIFLREEFSNRMERNWMHAAFNDITDIESEEVNIPGPSENTVVSSNEDGEFDTCTERVKTPVLVSNEDSPALSGTEVVPIDPQILEEENRILRQAKLCKICMDQDVNIVFLPCGHLISCSSCAANLPECPICRQVIKGTVRTFLA